MSFDVSGFGTTVILNASITFPAGVALDHWADDTDPFDVPSVTYRGTAMGVGGDLITWNQANPILATLAFIPGSPSDENMQILVEANRAARDKTSANDQIGVQVVYSSGQIVTFARGVLTDGMLAKSISSDSRQKTNTYQLVFESVVGTF